MALLARPGIELAALLLLAGCNQAPPQPPIAVVIASAAPSLAASAASPTPSASAAPAEKCISALPPGKEPAPRKRATADEFLEKQSVMLYVDTRRPGVVVPPHLAGQGRLVLQVGYAMAVPIPDLKVDGQGISGTLSFKGKPFFVRVPWPAVYAVQGANDKRGWVWYEDVPEDQRCK